MAKPKPITPDGSTIESDSLGTNPHEPDTRPIKPKR